MSDLSWSSVYESTSRSLPMLVSHANDLMPLPQSPKQLSQRRATPCCWTAYAGAARARASRVAKSEADLRMTASRRGWIGGPIPLGRERGHHQSTALGALRGQQEK